MPQGHLGEGCRDAHREFFQLLDKPDDSGTSRWGTQGCSRGVFPAAGLKLRIAQEVLFMVGSTGNKTPPASAKQECYLPERI